MFYFYTSFSYEAFWSEILQRRDYSEDLSIDVKIILEWILNKYGGNSWTGSSGSGQEQVEGSCDTAMNSRFPYMEKNFLTS
jgi:hypothetical protein